MRWPHPHDSCAAGLCIRPLKVGAAVSGRLFGGRIMESPCDILWPVCTNFTAVMYIARGPAAHWLDLAGRPLAYTSTEHSLSA